jgi:hypothetical protein
VPVDAETKSFKQVYLFNEKLVHLVDDIYWFKGFKSAEHAEKMLSKLIVVVLVLF